jgi:hypothetical protein
MASPAGFQNVASIPVAVAAAPPPDRCLALGTTSNCVEEAEPILEFCPKPKELIAIIIILVIIYFFIFLSV